MPVSGVIMNGMLTFFEGFFPKADIVLAGSGKRANGAYYKCIL